MTKNNNKNENKNFNLDVKEQNIKFNEIVSIGGKLPYYLELRTNKILDVLMTLYKNSSKLPEDRKESRNIINLWLYKHTKPNCYVELGSKLHIGYAHQKDGKGSQHYWRLFFDDLYKDQIEEIVNSTAIVVSPNTTEKQQNTKSGFEGMKEWGGMYFRSEAEISLAEELRKQGLLFFANVRGLIDTNPSPASDNQSNGRLELDFLVFYDGKYISIEIDGIHHQSQSQAQRDYTRDRLLLREKIPTARFTAEECYEIPETVVEEILCLLTD